MFDGVTIESEAKTLVFNIWNSASVTATDTILDGKKNDWEGAPFLLIGSYNGAHATLNFSGTSEIKDTTAAIQGGPNGSSKVNVAGGKLTISGSTLSIKDKVQFVVKSGAELVLDNTTIDLADHGDIRFIFVEEGGKLTIKDSTIKNAKNLGAIRSDGGTVVVEDSTFNNNSAKGADIQKNGGAILALENSTVDIKNSTFEGNNAADRGGAIYSAGGTLTIDDDTTFTGNEAGYWGGAVYVEDCELEIGAATFENNIAQDGGAICIGKYESETDSSSAVFNGTKFNENKARIKNPDNPGIRAIGGAVFVQKGATLDINGAKFTSNEAGTRGGALAVMYDAVANIKDLNGDPTEFVGNKVTEGLEFSGGAMYIDEATVNMEDAAIYGNTAKHVGGGVSTCIRGTTQIHVLDGAAIFDNEVLEDHTSFEKATTYKDVFLFTNDHMNYISGDDVEEIDIWQGHNEPYELYERMFNGGLHNWKTNIVENEHAHENGQTYKVKSMLAYSTPTNKNVNDAKVVFTQNSAEGHPDVEREISGGAIANNGKLNIGTQLVEIKLLKVWEDDSNNDGKRPSMEEYKNLIKDNKLVVEKEGEGPVNLSADNILVDVIDGKDADLSSNVVGNDDDNEKLKKLIEEKETYLIIISGLPTGKYTVKSDDVAEYTSTVEGRVITNTHENETVTFEVTKKWSDDENRDGVRPEEVTVNLMADGEKLESAVLSDNNDWTVKFADYPKYKAGKEIEYTVEEDDVAGYTVAVTGDVEKGFTVTNTHESEKTSVKVTKVWDDADDKDKIRPESVTITLIANGKSTGKSLTLNEENNWSGEFTDLPKNEGGNEITYTVNEDEVKDYTTTIAGSAAEGFTVTNKHTPKEEPTPEPAPGTTSISVTKDWNDENDMYGIRPESITVKLYGYTENGDDAYSDSIEITPDENGNWRGTFTDLPTVDENGNEIFYEVEEADVENYVSDVNYIDAKRVVLKNSYTEEFKKSKEQTTEPQTAPETKDKTTAKTTTKTTSKTTTKTTTTKKSPKTGDATNTAIYFILLGAAAATAGVVIYRRRRNEG